MEEKKITGINGGLNIWHVLTIIFVIAKIWGPLTWTWGTVFIPAYIWLGLIVLNVLASTAKNYLN